MNRRLCSSLLFASLWLVGIGGPVLAGELRPFTALYRLSHGYLPLAQVRVSLQLATDGGYHYQAHTRPSGAAALLRSDRVDESSRGMLHDGRVRPDRYRYQHDRPENPRRVELKFDWVRGRVTNRIDSDRWSMPVPADTQDKFSQQLALMLAQAADEPALLTLPVADGGPLREYHYRRLGREPVTTPAGVFTALKLERQKSGLNAAATFWLAPLQGYLPVRIERREHDGLLVMELETLRWEGDAPSSSE